MDPVGGESSLRGNSEGRTRIVGLIHALALGPVEKIVLNDKPLNKGSSLRAMSEDSTAAGVVDTHERNFASWPAPWLSDSFTPWFCRSSSHAKYRTKAGPSPMRLPRQPSISVALLMASRSAISEPRDVDVGKSNCLRRLLHWV